MLTLPSTPEESFLLEETSLSSQVLIRQYKIFQKSLRFFLDPVSPISVIIIYLLSSKWCVVCSNFPECVHFRIRERFLLFKIKRPLRCSGCVSAVTATQMLRGRIPWNTDSKEKAFQFKGKLLESGPHMPALSVSNQNLVSWVPKCLQFAYGGL